MSANPNASPSTGSMMMMTTTPTPSSIISDQPVASSSASSGSSEQAVPYYPRSSTDPLRIVLDCVFVLAAVSVVFGFFFWRYMAIRRARRPMRQFFRTTTDVYPSPQPQYSNIFLPMPTNLAVPPPSHAYERRVERTYGDTEWLPAYDDKDMPPKYQEAHGEYVAPHLDDHADNLPAPPPAGHL